MATKIIENIAHGHINKGEEKGAVSKLSVSGPCGMLPDEESGNAESESESVTSHPLLSDSMKMLILDECFVFWRTFSMVLFINKCKNHPQTLHSTVGTAINMANVAKDPDYTCQYWCWAWFVMNFIELDRRFN